MLHEQLSIQSELSKAVKSGDPKLVINALAKMESFQMKQVNVMKNIPLRMLATSPIFISVFYTIRAMAIYPIVSMKTGGLFWFADLTATDPYYLMPLFIGVSLHLILRSGIEFGNVNSPTTPPNFEKFLLYGMPGLTFVALSAWGCPSALLFYFCVNNSLSLVQSLILKRKEVKRYLKIPEAKEIDRKEFPTRGFMEQMEEMKMALAIARDYNAREVMTQAFKKPTTPGPTNSPPSSSSKNDHS